MIQDFSGGGGGVGWGVNISTTQHYGTRRWDLYCMFWFISCVCVLEY